MKTTTQRAIIILSIALTLIASLALRPSTAQDTGSVDKEKAGKGFPTKPAYSPYVGRDFPTRPFFGDTHLHTAFSFDAGAFGARLGPRDAYRFARGEQVTSSTGQPVKLSRPLDFLVVADHSDNMGFFPDLLAGKPELLAEIRWAGGGSTCSSQARALPRRSRLSRRSRRAPSRRISSTPPVRAP